MEMKKFANNFKKYVNTVVRISLKSFDEENLQKIFKASGDYSKIFESGKKNNNYTKSDNRLQLEKGTLIHGIGFNEEVLKSISEDGLLGPAFSGSIASDYTPYSVCFHVIPKNQSMKDYFEFYNKRFTGEELGDLMKQEGAALNYRLEYAYLPHKSRKEDQIAFIINRTEEIDKLLEHDEWKNNNTKLISPGFMNRYGKIPDRVATILFGIPVNAMSGILIPPAMEQDIEKIETLKRLFSDKYITTSEGELIYEPQIEKKQEDKSQEINKPDIHQDSQIRRNVLRPKDKLSISNMKRNVKLGNSGEMHRYIAADGSKYLVKPAYKKHTKNVEAFRAFIQRAAYDVQKIVDPNSAVTCNVKMLDIGGQEIIGSIQDEIDGINFDEMPGLPREKLQKYGSQFLREFVTDYLLGNYDSHSGNFIIDKNGILRGIDKEQSLKYITDERTKKVDITYAPNGIMHQPVYNKLFSMYAKGMIDLDLKQVSSYLERVDKIPDEEYRKIFEGYAHTRANTEQEKKELLDKIVQRKKQARENIEEFLIDIVSQRKAKEIGITPEEVKKRGFEIVKNSKSAASRIASGNLASDVQSTYRELKAVYKEVENITPELNNNDKSIEE